MAAPAVLTALILGSLPALRWSATEAGIPALVLRAPAGGWDLSGWQAVAVSARNDGPKGAILMLRVDDAPREAGTWTLNTGWTWLEPAQTADLRVRIIRKGPPDIAFIGMRTAPGLVSDEPEAVAAGAVTSVEVFAEGGESRAFTLGPVRAVGPAHRLPPRDRLFPFVDEYGQYRHLDWPGKTLAEADFPRRLAEEDADLAAHPAPSDRDRWGGWAAGPKRRATGWFRVEKVRGAWWLVDPDGRLFFSHGIDVVDWWNGTPIAERDRWFRGEPWQEDRFREFTGEAPRAVRGHYKDREKIAWFDFWRANLKRKFGAAWRATAADRAHRRLASWGLNTIGAWSALDILTMRRTPYAATTALHGAPVLRGHEGFWQPFYDVFDPGFLETARKKMASGQPKAAAGDPWCIGFFVDNELSWDDDTQLALATLSCPPDQPAKRAFASDLTRKYRTVTRLNRAWGTAYPSWQALLDAREVPATLTDTGRPQPQADLKAFVRKTAETYFGTVRRAVKEAAPHQLYLGCRLAWYGPEVARAAAKHCDVVSFNFYRRSVAGAKEFPDGVDAPMLSGEFHFGALDRGQFDPGMMEVADQEERGRAYREYVEGALRHPQFVGTHWFQYMDQPVTGRPLDGEPAAVGFVDICDTPHPAMREAARGVGARLYAVRAAAFPPVRR